MFFAFPLARAVLKVLFVDMVLSKRNASGGFADKKAALRSAEEVEKGIRVGADLEKFLRPTDGNVFNILIYLLFCVYRPVGCRFW